MIVTLIYNLLKNTPGVEKEQPRTQIDLAEKDVKSNGRPILMPHGFDKFKSFGHDELTAKHCYFRCSRPPDVDGIKIFDKDATRPQNTAFYLDVL